jgi:hypothetical protein
LRFPGRLQLLERSQGIILVLQRPRDHHRYILHNKPPTTTMSF